MYYVFGLTFLQIPTKTCERQRVCAEFFLQLMEMKQRRVLTVARGVFSGTGFSEKRGGPRQSTARAQKEKAVIAFIKQLRVNESHYGRAKSQRLYLSSELNVRKLWKLYNSQADEELKVCLTGSTEYSFRNFCEYHSKLVTDDNSLIFQVLYNYFYSVFTEKFNIGFGSPATDTCSACARYDDNIKAARSIQNVQRVKELRVQKKLHKAKAQGFHASMRRQLPESVSFAFDLQQVQYLPKLPIGECFYKRQLPLYVFCVCNAAKGQSREPSFYTWMGHEGKRGAEEITSAVVHYLDTSRSLWPKPVRTLYLYCDGCGGQNKNKFLVHGLAYWLYNDAPKELCTIEIIYPVRGHSFLPPDGVFGHVEKDLRRKPEIIQPAEYHKIYSEHGLLRILNRDWKIRQFKDLDAYMNTLTGIQTASRIVLKKTSHTVLYKFEVNYFSADKSKKFVDIMKRKQKVKLAHIILPRVKNNPVPVDDKVKADLDSLLTSRYGEEWRQCSPLKMYVNIIDQPVAALETEEDADECCCLDDDDAMP